MLAMQGQPHDAREGATTPAHACLTASAALLQGDQGSAIRPPAGRAMSRKRKAEVMAEEPAAKLEGDSSDAEPAGAEELSGGPRAAEQWARVR